MFENPPQYVINLLAAVLVALWLKEAVVAWLSSPLQGAPTHLEYHRDILILLRTLHLPSSQAPPRPLQGAHGVPRGVPGVPLGDLRGAHDVLHDARDVLHDAHDVLRGALHDDPHQP